MGYDYGNGSGFDDVQGGEEEVTPSIWDYVSCLSETM